MVPPACRVRRVPSLSSPPTFPPACRVPPVRQVRLTTEFTASPACLPSPPKVPTACRVHQHSRWSAETIESPAYLTSTPRIPPACLSSSPSLAYLPSKPRALPACRVCHSPACLSLLYPTPPSPLPEACRDGRPEIQVSTGAMSYCPS